MSAAARCEFPALGTGAVVVVDDPAALDDAVAAAKSEIDAIDRACSRFRGDSDLERVNGAHGRAVAVSEVLLDAVQVAVDAARWTDGDVDPTIGRALRLLGYDRDFARLEAGDVVLRFGEVAGWRVIELDRARGTLRVPAGVQLDLGATAKALAADRAALAASGAAHGAALVSLGGDVACAGPNPPGGWPVLVTDWHGARYDEPGSAGEVIMLNGGGLATSSTTVRRWRRGAVDMHHVIDPASGRPASEHWRTVSVIAASCVQANIATTATIVRGASGETWLRSLGVPARLVRHDGSVVHVEPWPVEDAA
ncbi:MAG: FAD:protein transferase [Acidimicrobiales bacterium]|nr:FAD:protein transferase [Acidimicrobiales bacterium]